MLPGQPEAEAGVVPALIPVCWKAHWPLYVEQTWDPSARLALKISPTQKVVLTMLVCNGYLLAAGAAAGAAAATARGAAASGAGSGAETAAGAGSSTDAAAGVALGEGEGFSTAGDALALADEGLAEADGPGAGWAAQPAVNTPIRRINTAMMGVVMCFIYLGYISVGDINRDGRSPMRARQVRVMTARLAQQWLRPESMLIVKPAEPLTPQKQPAGPSRDP